MAQGNFKQTLAAARKILGDDADIPSTKDAEITKAMNDLDATLDAAITKRSPRIFKISEIIDEEEKQAGDYQNLASRLDNALDLAKTALSTSTYRLQPADPEDKKKIAGARKLFKAYFDDAEKKAAALVKSGDWHIRELEKMKNALTAFN